MKNFDILDADDKSQYEEWLKVWAAWGADEVFAHPEYVRLFTREGDHALCALQQSGSGLIMMPMVLRPISKESWCGEYNFYHDIIAPYGYSGPYAAGDFDMGEFWREFTEWAQKSKVVSAFFRFSPFAADLTGFVDNIEFCGEIVIRSLTEGKEEVWNNFKHAVRTCVRCAEGAGLKVIFDLQGERLKDFIRIYYQTMQRLNATQQYYFSPIFFETIVKKLPGLFVFGHVVYEEKVIASKLVLVTKDHLFPFLGGSDSTYFDLNPNQLLDKEIFYWGIDHQKKSCVLGGGYDGQADGVFQYKKKFAPFGIAPYKIGKHIFDKNVYQSMCEKRKQYNVSNGKTWMIDGRFFPEYRAKYD